MLDSETKRRIDTARDILVGKVPDPKSQVEQITIALIYKFMDDMDAQAEELGGKRKFFAGEFAPYGWAKLMAPSVSGEERIALYADGMVKMTQNPGVPQLFRNIFKNAFLPYRDPETLKAFLKTINDFEYDHSERLGDAFEYLLSVLGSQGDAGQFRTPRHIIDFIVSIVDPKKNETVLDPACGTAGFMISAYKHILRANSEPQPASRNALAPGGLANIAPGANASGSLNTAPGANASGSLASGSLLSPDERKRLADNFRGYDISPDMVRLSLVNLYLHGFTDPHVCEYDTLTSQDRWNEMADVILANPPFMSPKGGIKPHNRFSVQSKRSEVLFVDYMAEHLTPGGRAGIIVPEGIIFQSQTAYKALRKMLVEQYLVAVVSLPAGVFQPYSGVKTSILILDRSLAKQSDTVGFFKVESDGFGLGAQRRASEKNDLPDILAAVQEYLRGEANRDGNREANRDRQDAQDKKGKPKSSSCPSCSSLFQSLIDRRQALIVAKEKIAANGDFNLSGEQYRDSAARSSTFPFVALGEVCELARGVVYNKGDEVEAGGVSVLRANNINEARSSLDLSDVKQIAPKEDFSDDKKLRKDDIFICLASGSKDHIGKVAFIPSDTDYYFGGFMGAVRVKSKRVIPGYLFHLLREDHFNNFLREQITGANINNLSGGLLYRFEIPLPPLEVQQEIVAEIEGYQKVIDGARAVLDHYRPHIPIDPEWPMVELGEICDFKNGLNFKSGESGHAVKIIGVGDFQNHLYAPIATLGEVHLDESLGSDYLVKPGDILFVRSNGNPDLVGRSMIIPQTNERITFTGFSIRARAQDDRVLPIFLVHFFKSRDFAEGIKQVGQGANIRNLSQGILNDFQIPIPPLPTQREIVTEIEAEQRLVEGNRQLIERMEKKIAAALGRIWGEEPAAKVSAGIGELAR